MSTQSTPTGPLRVALYARTSTPGQEKDESIDSQINALRTATVERGYILIDLYADDGYSGYTLVRPALDRLARRLENDGPARSGHRPRGHLAARQ